MYRHEPNPLFFLNGIVCIACVYVGMMRSSFTTALLISCTQSTLKDPRRQPADWKCCGPRQAHRVERSVRRAVGLWLLRMCVHVPTKHSLALDRGCMYRTCVYVVTVRSSFTNALSVPCKRYTLRVLGHNRLTGRVEALGHLSKLANLCVGE